MIELAVATVFAGIYFFVVAIGVPMMSFVSFISRWRKQKQEREFQPAKPEDCEVRQVFCPNNKKESQVTIVGLHERENPETHLFPLRIASCTMPRNPSICCGQRCIKDMCKCA